MKIVVTANGTELDAPASPVFGRCPIYIFVVLVNEMVGICVWAEKGV